MTTAFMARSRTLAAVSIIRAFLALCRVKLELRFRGFGYALARVHSMVSARQIGNVDSAAVVDQAARDVAYAGAFFPGRARCLEQSLVLYGALRRRGVDSRLRLGVQPYGFTAHAWVEYAGRPVNENGELLRKVVPLPDLMP